MTKAPPGRLTLPNVISLGRIVVCPVLFWLALSPSTSLRFGAFALFLVAALSDLWDGYLARKHGLITDLGKLLDPLADKLLMLSTFIPFYIVSHRPGILNDVPWWGPLPAWILIVIFGRELFITIFRQYASRKGVVIAAGKSGKYKALFQAMFAGGLLLWYPLQQVVLEQGVREMPTWVVWSAVHRGFVGVTLLVALVLTIYSLIDYLWSYRSLVGVRN